MSQQRGVGGRRSQSMPSASGLFDSNANSAVPISAAIIDAAALQSEMMKKYGVHHNQNLMLKVNPSAHPKGKRPSKERKLYSTPEPQTCPSCAHQVVPNPEQGINIEFCEFCGYFLNTKRPEPTLAQKRGLVPMNDKDFDPMKPLDWYLVERNIQKKVEPDAFCPICMGPFTNSEEVLLSCGHIFHKICLRSFENFVKNADISCPICRTKNYQKKMTNLGSLSYQKNCVKKIQTIWRGYSTRRAFHHRLKAHYKQGKGDERLRKAFFEKEFSSVNAKMNKNMEERSDQVNSLLQSMDRTLLESRQLDELFSQMLAARMNPSGTSAGGDGADVPRPPPVSTAAEDGSLDFPSQLVTEAGEIVRYYYPEEYCADMTCSWEDIAQQSVLRGPGDCAICMVPIVCPILFGGHPGPAGHNKRSVLLSCSHLFHEWCLGSFERFSRSSEKSCPICRATYQKRVLQS